MNTGRGWLWSKQEERKESALTPVHVAGFGCIVKGHLVILCHALIARFFEKGLFDRMTLRPKDCIRIANP
jgi:hypothetical protein